MSPVSDKKIFDLIEFIYEAAGELSADIFSSLYEEISKILSSGPGGLSLYLSGDNRFEFLASTLNGELLKEYEEYYRHVSPFFNRIVQMNTGDVFNRVEFCADDEFRKAEIYKYYKKQGVFNFNYQVLFKESGVAGGISFSRPETMSDFSDGEQQAMRFIIPHLRKSMQISVKFAQSRQERELLTECLSKISQGVIVLNDFGKVVFLNDSAQKLVDANDGLQIKRDGILTAVYLSDTKRLRMLTDGVFKPSLERRTAHGGILQVSRPSGLRPLSLLISPFSEYRGLFGSKKFALIFINDPERKMEKIEPILSEIYGLTAAESKLAVILAQGKSLGEATHLLGVKPNTTRTHLKRIFSKTETNRQSELVKLIVSNSIGC